MKTYTTDTGIKLLMPLVPKNATALNIWTGLLNYVSSGWGTVCLLKQPLDTSFTILGTCWYEGDKIMYDDQLGILDWVVGDSYYMDQEVAFNSWLRTNNINIPEGFKAVLIQVK